MSLRSLDVRALLGRVGVRRAALGVAAVALAGAAVYAVTTPFAKPAPGHNPFHVNCPPGSHGQSWSANHGKSFLAGRRQSTSGDAARASERP